MKVSKFLKVFMLATLVLASCKAESSIAIYKNDFFGAFDTVHQLIAYTDSQASFDAYLKMYKEETQRLHNLFTSFEDVADVKNIKTINDNAGIAPVVVEKEIIDLLKKSIEWNKTISAQVNIALGPVIELWHTAREDAAMGISFSIPSKEALENANQCTDINDIMIDEAASSVYLKRGCMRLDVGAIAKGFAVEIAAQKLESAGLTSAAISAGGNVRVIGKRLIEKTERDELERCVKELCIGVSAPVFGDQALDKDNPYANFGLISKIVATDLSIVTSGDYQRYFVVDGKVYHHIIDPKTLMPAYTYRSITVVTPDSGYADFMSSALFFMTLEEGMAYVEETENLEAVWLMPSGEILHSKGLVEDDNYLSIANE